MILLGSSYISYKIDFFVIKPCQQIKLMLVQSLLAVDLTFLLYGTRNKLLCLIHIVAKMKTAIFHGKYGNKYRNNSKVKVKDGEIHFSLQNNFISLIKIKSTSKSYSSRINL